MTFPVVQGRGSRDGKTGEQNLVNCVGHVSPKRAPPKPLKSASPSQSMTGRWGKYQKQAKPNSQRGLPPRGLLAVAPNIPQSHMLFPASFSEAKSWHHVSTAVAITFRKDPGQHVKPLASCPEGLVSPSDISTQDKDRELQDTKGAQAWLTQDCGSPSSPSPSGSGSPCWLSCQAGASGLTTVGKLEGQHAALVQMQLVLVGLGVVQDLHIAALHAHS